MARPGGEFPVRPERAVGPAKGEGVFTDRALAFKPNVL